MRPDPRCYGAQRRLTAQGLHAETVVIRQVMPNTGKFTAERPSGKRHTFTIDNPALIEHLQTVLGRPGALPSPAVLYATTRAELLTNRFFVWMPGEGDNSAHASRADRNRREDNLRVQSSAKPRRGRNQRQATPDRVPRLF